MTSATAALEFWSTHSLVKCPEALARPAGAGQELRLYPLLDVGRRLIERVDQQQRGLRVGPQLLDHAAEPRRAGHH